MHRQFLAFNCLVAVTCVYSLSPSPDVSSVSSDSTPFMPAAFTQEGFPIRMDGQEMHLIQREKNGPQRWMTEDEVYALKRNDQGFMDVTYQPRLAEAADTVHRTQLRTSGSIQNTNTKSVPPSTAAVVALSHVAIAQPIVNSCNTTLARSTLERLTQYYNRFYRSETGELSARWMYAHVQSLAKSAHNGVQINVQLFSHQFRQPSIIARIGGQPGQNETVILGAHFDSINGNDRAGRAPGADDDGSGSVAQLEAFRALVASGFQPKRPIEFHWYAGEEAGLLGSQDIAASYQKAGHRIAGMMQLDMTGVPARGRPNEVGIVTDNVDMTLTQLLEKIFTQYVPDVTTRRFTCGYGCSDHASWTKAGYMSSFPFESAGLTDNKDIHSPTDSIEKINFDHLLRFAKVAVGFAVELSLA